MIIQKCPLYLSFISVEFLTIIRNLIPAFFLVTTLRGNILIVKMRECLENVFKQEGEQENEKQILKVQRERK